MHPSRFISRALLGALILVVLMPAVALGISRDVVLARGKVWVDKKTPYSQTRWAKVNGTLIPSTTKNASTLGYRTDCSGFVSMCLGLTNSKNVPISLTTRTLSPSTVTTITKAALLPGDVILKRGSHVMIFVRWADSAKKTFKAYEEKGTVDDCVESTRNYADSIEWGYYPYRYKKIDDFYPDTQEAIYGATIYETGDAAVRIAFPTTSTATVKTLVVTNDDIWTGNLGGAALAGATGGPLLLTGKTKLPVATYEALKRLKPQTVHVIGGEATVSRAVTDKIATLGIKVVRTTGGGYAASASAAQTAVALARANGRKVDVAYLVASNDFTDGVAVSPIAARTARPILLTARTKLPAETLEALKKTGIKRVYVLGGTNSIASSVMTELRAHGITVTRKGGATSYDTALLIAHHGTGIGGAKLTWSRVGVASNTSLYGTLASGVAQGQSGSLLLFTPGDKLYSGAAAEIAEQRSVIGKVRVFGGYNMIGLSVRSSIAKIMSAK